MLSNTRVIASTSPLLRRKAQLQTRRDASAAPDPSRTRPESEATVRADRKPIAI